MKGLKQIDGSTIWADGSRTYPPAMQRAKEPAETYPYPPAAGGIPVEVANETPAQGSPMVPVAQVSQGPFPPTIPQIMTREVDPLPPNPSAADVWDRWGKLVTNWNCLIAWGGGNLDKLTAAVGSNMPIYPKGLQNKTAVGWWRDVQAAGYDKAGALADLGKGLGVDANDVAAMIGQLNDLGALARAKGYTGCPPPVAQNPTAPPAPPGAMATAQGWWGGLSRGGKVVTGIVVLGALGLVIRGAAK